MIDNLLTMSEIIQMVTDVRTKDAGIIQKMAEIMTAYAEYEKNRLPPCTATPQRTLRAASAAGRTRSSRTKKLPTMSESR